MTVIEKMKEWLAICQQSNVPYDQIISHFERTLAFHKPPGEPGSDPEVIEQIWSRIQEAIRVAEDKTDTGTTKHMVREAGGNADNRSDVAKISYRLRQHPELEFDRRSGAGHWIKRLNGPVEGTA